MLCSCVAIARNLKEEAAAKRMLSLEYPIDYIEIFTPKSFFSFQQFHASHYHEREILQVITLRASRLDSSLHDRKCMQSAKFAWSILHSELNKAPVLPPIEGNDKGRTTNTQTHREDEQEVVLISMNICSNSTIWKRGESVKFIQILQQRQQSKLIKIVVM